MLKTKTMCRISIVGSKSVMKESIGVLHKMALLHIDEFKGGPAPLDGIALEMGAPLPGSEAISAALVKVRSMAAHLPKVSRAPAKAAHGKEAADARQLEKLDSEIKAHTDALKTLDDEKGRLSARLAELRPFAASPLRLEDFGDYSSISVFAGYISKKAALDELETKVRARLPKSGMFSWEYEGKTIIALFVNAEKKENARELLSDYGYSEINLAPLKGLKGNVSEMLTALERERLKLDEKRERLNAELVRISGNWLSFVREKESRLLADSEKAQAPLKFATTTNAFIAEGWIPEEKCPEVKKRLAEETKNRVYVEESPHIHDAPVLLENPRPANSFEFFMDLYALPKYSEIDPSFLMFLTFPIFFGMMLGDIGYGVVSLAVFSFLKRKFGSAQMKSLLNVMSISAVASIAFGFVFGEFFGEEEIAGFALPHLISRVHGVSEMLLVTAGIGILHITFGFILGFINKLGHGFRHALLEKGSWLILELGIALFAASYLNYISISKYVGIAIALAAIIMLFKGEGIKGIVEIPALLSNSLSYARIMAVGLASASLAIVINEFAKEFFHLGGFYIIAAVIILVLGHAINFALGILGPFLHSLRLHYVEFFTKFFEGGGKRYQPFGARVAGE